MLSLMLHVHAFIYYSTNISVYMYIIRISSFIQTEHEGKRENCSVIKTYPKTKRPIPSGTTTSTLPRCLTHKLRMRDSTYYFVLPQAINEEPPERVLINIKYLHLEREFLIHPWFYTWSHTTPS